jgi:GMP synthase-like glutamine amidotransferase
LWPQADDGTRIASLLQNNTARTPMKNLVPEHLGWRIKPGILGQHASSPQSVHALLGYFLKDRESPTPFPGRDRLAREGLFDWGLGPPLEKVIEGPQHLQHLLQVPELYRQSVAIIEPWPDVGTNPRGEQVRASKNIAYMLQQIADADTILYPVWRSGIENPGRLANVLSAGIATVVQGGNPSVHDARSFDGGKASLEELLSLVDELLLRRSTGSGPSIFICLGHQLAAASHIRLVRRAALEVLGLTQLSMDASGRALAALQRLCQHIVQVGESLRVIKSGEIVATGWDHPGFAVARNESLEIGTRRLMHYAQRGDRSHIPEDLHATHALVADELEGVIDVLMTLEREVYVEMFHGDEVNEEAALFANWAYKSLHDAIIPMRHALAVSPVSWLLSLPYAVEMLGQTRVDDASWTEVSSTAIYYKDWETRRIRRSFTCQFHPELMADIRDIGGRSGPRYQELKENDGVRLFMQLLYHGMQE